MAKRNSKKTYWSERGQKLEDDIDDAMTVLVGIFESEQPTDNIVYENLTRSELLEQITIIRSSIEQAVCHLGRTAWSEEYMTGSDKKESNDISSAATTTTTTTSTALCGANVNIVTTTANSVASHERYSPRGYCGSCGAAVNSATVKTHLCPPGPSPRPHHCSSCGVDINSVTEEAHPCIRR